MLLHIPNRHILSQALNPPPPKNHFFTFGHQAAVGLFFFYQSFIFELHVAMQTHTAQLHIFPSPFPQVVVHQLTMK